MERRQATKIALRMSDSRAADADDEAIAETTRILMASAIAGFPHEIVDATLDMLKAEYDRVTPRSLVRACQERPVVPRRPMLPAPEDASGPALRRMYFPDRPNGREPFPVAHPDERERERARVFYASAALPATIVSRPDLGIRADHVAQADAMRKRTVADLEAKLGQLDDRVELDATEREIVAGAQERLDQLRRAMAQRTERETLAPARRGFMKRLVAVGRLMVAEGALRCVGCGKRDLDAGDLEGAIEAIMRAGAHDAGHLYCHKCRTGAWMDERPNANGHPQWQLDPEVGLPPDELAQLMRNEAGPSDDAEPRAAEGPRRYRG